MARGNERAEDEDVSRKTERFVNMAWSWSKSAIFDGKNLGIN